MARLSFLGLLVPLSLCIFGQASPLTDPQVQAWLNQRDSGLKPLTLTRRDASGYKPRHLRPVYDSAPVLNKRQPPDLGEEATFKGGKPQPVRGALGDTFLASTNTEIDAQNPDNVAPPPTDSGVVPNLKWSMSLSHQKLVKGGWVREQTVTDLPTSKDLAAAEIRLSPGAYRELHWHRVAEWGYVLNGTGRISAISEDGKSYTSDIKGPVNGSQPDLYYFPEGVPHSIQALDQGLELLLIFTDGNFDASGTTFMLADWLSHTPLAVVAQNFNISVDLLKGIPAKDPYIYASSSPPPGYGQFHGEGTEEPNPYVFHIGDQPKTGEGSGGWIKIQDSKNWPASAHISSSLVFVEPNGLRELHWHTSDEWMYILSGKGRGTAFAGGATARTFDFQAGDTAVWPVAYGHYMENTSPTEPLIFIEVFKAPRYVDFSATQWIAATPAHITADLLNISTSVIEKFQRQKQWVVGR